MKSILKSPILCAALLAMVPAAMAEKPAPVAAKDQVTQDLLEKVKQQLKELYAQYKGTKYTVVVFLSGKRDLYEDTRDLLLFNRRRAAERAVQDRKAAGQ